MPLEEADLRNPISSDVSGQKGLSHEEPNSDPPDLPPDSFWIRKEDEFDWYDRNAFMERKGSTKAISGNLNFTPGRHSNSSSQNPIHLNAKSNLSIIGLPKFQIPRAGDGNLRRNSKAENVKLFRSRSEPDGKSAGLASEPGSPLVSCIGRVRSKRGRIKRTGMWATLRAVFRAGVRANRVVSKGSGELGKQGNEPAGSVGKSRLVSGMKSESLGGKFSTCQSEEGGDNTRGGV